MFVSGAAPLVPLSADECAAVCGGIGPSWSSVFQFAYGELDDFCKGFASGYADATR